MKLLLTIMVTFIAFTSTVTGFLVICYPEELILELSKPLLNFTLFNNYIVSGVLLIVLVGGANMIAVFYNIQRHPKRYNWSITAGVLTISWILLQAFLIYNFHLSHFLYLLTGLFIILIAYQLKGRWAV